MFTGWLVRFCSAFLLVGGWTAEAQSSCGQSNNTAAFVLTLSWKELAPDGFKRKVITVNDQYPGPLLRFKQGVDVKVVVMNMLDQPSSLHWHGIDQRGSPSMDGVSGITQEPIRPGDNFTYCFATLHQPPGTYIYHAHVGSQYPNGLYGPIIIDPVEDALRVYESRVEGDYFAILNDWYHPDYETLVKNALATNRVPACANSLLINGKGRVRCGDEIACTVGNDMGSMNMSSTATSRSGTTTAMASMSMPMPMPTPSTAAASPMTTTTGMASMAGMMHKRQMSDHNMMPGTSASRTASATMGSMPTPGQDGMTLDTSNLDGCIESSSDLEIYSMKANATYRFRFANIGAFTNLNVAIDGHKMTIIETDGVLVKDTQKVDVLTVSIGQRYSVLVKADQRPGNYWLRTWRTDAMQKLEGRAIVRYEGAPLVDPSGSPSMRETYSQSLQLKPLRDVPPPAMANRTLNLGVRAFADNNWTLQGDLPGFFPDPFGKPLLSNPISNPNVISLGYGDVVDLVLQVDNRSVDPMAHPFHLHGQSFWVMGSGNGTFDASRINTIDPPYRDTELLPANGWLVLRFVSNNPGTWFFHCHVDLHMMSGLNLVFDVARTNSSTSGHNSSGMGKKVGPLMHVGVITMIISLFL